MSVDYDAPRGMPEEGATDPPDELRIGKAGSGGSPIDLDGADLADSFDLPGADLSHEELLVQVVPAQQDEFTCTTCFLVHHRSQLAREKDGKKYCSECEG